MNKKPFNILRAGLALTFIWIGVLILRNPIAWAGYIQPWVLQYIPGSLEAAMIQTGYLDIAVGLMLLIRPTVWLGGLFGALHLIIVLITANVTDVTVRDIGLLFASVSLFIQTCPEWLSNKIKILR